MQSGQTHGQSMFILVRRVLQYTEFYDDCHPLVLSACSYNLYAKKLLNLQTWVVFVTLSTGGTPAGREEEETQIAVKVLGNASEVGAGW